MKLIVSCRDVGSSAHLVEIVKDRNFQKMQCIVVVQEPANSIFKENNISTKKISLLPATDPNSKEAQALLDCAQSLINDYQPDAILSGLTTPFDGGIDEALISVAKGKVPTFLLQDFWGERNNFFGEDADYTFCLDEEAANLTALHTESVPYIIGAPKYSIYKEYDFLQLREKGRALIYTRSSCRVLGYFGQALHRLEGYTKTIHAWAKAVAQLPYKPTIVYRPHPRESEKNQRDTLEIFSQYHLAVKVIPVSVDSLTAISVCNIICSPFSLCSYDAAHVNYFTKRGFIVPINLLFDEQVREYYYNVIHLEKTPFSKLGLSLNVESEASLHSTLQYANTLACQSKIGESSLQLSDPTDAPSKVVKFICTMQDKHKLPVA